MNVTLIGMGSGQPENLTLQGLAALRQADLTLGARRLLAVLPAGCTENRAAAYRPDEVAELLQTSGAENAVLVYSGDTGFYSGASSMMEKLEALGVRARVLPGLSSIQLLAAALDLLRHCTVNQFEVWRNGERMTALPVLILILLVLVAYWISLPLLVVGLFFGCKYRFSGPDLDKNRVGEVVNQVSAKVGDAVGQVRDEFKREFGKSRGKKGK